MTLAVIPRRFEKIKCLPATVEGPGGIASRLLGTVFFFPKKGYSSNIGKVRKVYQHDSWSLEERLCRIGQYTEAFRTISDDLNETY